MKLINEILKRFNYISIPTNDCILKEIINTSIINNEINFWKFICMPRIEIDPKLKLKIDWNDKRYDTLSLSVKKDEVLNKYFKRKGINAEIEYIFDDWEVLFLRSNEIYQRQNEPNKLELRKRLEALKAEIVSWVKEVTKNSKCVFFSDLIEYQDLISGMQFIERVIRIDPVYGKVIDAEVKFLKEINGNKDKEFENFDEAKCRLIQYATEAIILYVKGYDRKIFLDSEYPTMSTYNKLNYIVKLPTLFYCRDNEINNVS